MIIDQNKLLNYVLIKYADKIKYYYILLFLHLYYLSCFPLCSNAAT
jgi:hypothetical protein